MIRCNISSLKVFTRIFKGFSIFNNTLAYCHLSLQAALGTIVDRYSSSPESKRIFRFAFSNGLPYQGFHNRMCYECLIRQWFYYHLRLLFSLNLREATTIDEAKIMPSPPLTLSSGLNISCDAYVWLGCKQHQCYSHNLVDNVYTKHLVVLVLRPISPFMSPLLNWSTSVSVKHTQ